MALEGTINTPIGHLQKKTAVLVGGFVLVLGVIVYYRNKQLGGGDVSIPDAPINPATGYPYGSPEDAAALADQASYVSPSGGSGGGGASQIPQSNVGYTSNGQWTQAVIATLTSNGGVEDPAALSAALGKYIAGQYIPPGSNDDVLIAQAISVEGYPPVAAASGYPPSINRNAPNGGAATPNNATKIVGMHVIGSTTNTVTVGWGFDGQKPDYIQMILNGVPVGNVYGTYTVYQFKGLKSKTKYNFQALGYKNATPGTPGIVQGTTK